MALETGPRPLVYAVLEDRGMEEEEVCCMCVRVCVCICVSICVNLCSVYTAPIPKG